MLTRGVTINHRVHETGGPNASMGDFVEAALDFPAVLFSFLLLVVIGYWMVVLFGGLGVDALDAGRHGIGTEGAESADGAGTDGADSGAGLSDAGLSGLLTAAGLGGVPVTVVASLLIAVAWFASLAGTVLLPGAALAVVVLIAALAVAWLTTRLLVSPLRRVFRTDSGPSRNAFVGRLCVIRTTRVGTDFGQAEVHAADGSSAIVQVRQTGTDPLGTGSTALIYDYDPDGELFWVIPRPGQGPTPGQRNN